MIILNKLAWKWRGIFMNGFKIIPIVILTQKVNWFYVEMFYEEINSFECFIIDGMNVKQIILKFWKIIELFMNNVAKTFQFSELCE